MSDIINIVDISKANEVQFKDMRLNEATQKIMAIYEDAKKYADQKNREIACILSDVKKEKSYEADGFKSVADYAETVFGIKRANAYALANAGTVYNNPDTPEAVKNMTPSKVAEIATVNRAAVQKALDEGRISETSTQKELREFAKTAQPADAKAEKPKVLPLYAVKFIGDSSRDRLFTWWNENYYDENGDYDRQNFMGGTKTLDDWKDYIVYLINNAVLNSSGVEIQELSKAFNKDGKKTLPRFLFMTENFCIVAQFEKSTLLPIKKTAHDKVKKLSEMDINEVRELLARMEREAQDAEEVPAEEDDTRK